MTYSKGDTAFVVKAVPAASGPEEFRQSMRPHPLVYQELPHDPEFGIYNRRLRSLYYNNVPTADLYWRLRTQVGLAHTGELATEIRGPDAATLLNHVFTRDVTRMNSGRCSYALACFADGGMIMDGLLLRLADDRFWYVQGDGEFPLWLHAHSAGFDAEVIDPGIWISQVQGPRSMDVLARASDDGMPDSFGYFDLARVHIGGQPLVISRTGFTNELGWEFYIEPDADACVIGERILEAGEPYGIHTIPAAATNARRIEAGLLLSGTDFDHSVTPFAAGLEAFVDLSKTDFVGMAALNSAARGKRTWGLKCLDGVPRHGAALLLDGKSVGRVTSSASSPYLQCGIAIVRLIDSDFVPGTQLLVECTDDITRTSEVCDLPMYDRNREIPRGKRTDIPEIPL